jgi:cell division transport system ATP-binding protein
MIRSTAVGLEYGRGQPQTVLHDLRFSIPSGEFRWLVGPSGAGKSSLLRLLYLSVRPTSGELCVLGVDVASARRHVLPRLRQRIGVVFQDLRLLPNLSAFDNVALPLRIAGVAEAQLRADVSDMLEWVGLRPQQAALPQQLSGSEQQRVAIARAVIVRPSLLLADEPATDLDEEQTERLMTLLGELNRLGTTVVIATHDDSMVARHPAPTLVLDGGRLVGEATDG